jgi:hypothetical protein
MNPHGSTERQTTPDDALNESTATLERADLPRLFEALRARGYQVVGPTVRD